MCAGVPEKEVFDLLRSSFGIFGGLIMQLRQKSLVAAAVADAAVVCVCRVSCFHVYV